VFFLSDGSAGYPASVLQQLRYDPTVWAKIEMEALGFGHQQTNFDTLKRISQFFGPEKGDFAVATRQEDLQRKLIEITDHVKQEVDELNYNYRCAADRCGPGSRLLDTGRCEACPPFTRGDGGQACSAASCPGGFVNEDASCGTCGDYQRYDQF